MPSSSANSMSHQCNYFCHPQNHPSHSATKYLYCFVQTVLWNVWVWTSVLVYESCTHWYQYMWRHSRTIQSPPILQTPGTPAWYFCSSVKSQSSFPTGRSCVGRPAPMFRNWVRWVTSAPTCISHLTCCHSLSWHPVTKWNLQEGGYCISFVYDCNTSI